MNARTTPEGWYRRRPASRGAAAALVAGVLVLSGCGSAAPSNPGQASPPAGAASSVAPPDSPLPQAAAPNGAAPSSPDASGPAPSSTSQPGEITLRPATLPANAPAPAPTSLTVAGTAIDMPVVPGGVSTGGAMEIPDVFDRAAWYRFGPAPGAAEGAAVIAGHIDTTSDRAPFSALKSLPAGTIIRVGRDGAPALSYRVVGVELMAKDRFDGASLFRRSGPHELKLVTCGGKWLDERMDYSDNVIVTAVPA
ncbi:class F sortase [Arthrobacter sp. NQ4]|uniref:class F sortase n=1 Tax=Arthrobacter sp. NQ4 TaxID=3027930 RepID=UPI0023B1B40F|nr:sortase [Arthrobacter sp. NQ4]MDE8588792.1 sortase [Arthrobacter sp. NQ4]